MDGLALGEDEGVRLVERLRRRQPLQGGGGRRRFGEDEQLGLVGECDDEGLPQNGVGGRGLQREGDGGARDGVDHGGDGEGAGVEGEGAGVCGGEGEEGGGGDGGRGEIEVESEGDVGGEGVGGVGVGVRVDRSHLGENEGRRTAAVDGGEAVEETSGRRKLKWKAH